MITYGYASGKEWHETPRDRVRAWDMFAAAVLSHESFSTFGAANVADEMLKERDRRFATEVVKKRKRREAKR